jgi:F0F1-type ATP synthase assembly protein I
VSRKKSWVVMVSEYTQLAFVLPAATFAGYVIGYLLDRAFGTHFFYLVFLLIGIAAGFLQIIRKVTKDSEDSE